MKSILISFGICLSILTAPAFMLAQTTPPPAGQQTQNPIVYKSIVELPLPSAASGVDSSGNQINRANLTAEQFVTILYALSISIAALLAVIKIIYGGVQYMLTDVVTSKAGAKKDIYGAILGLIIVLAAVFILQTINPQLNTLSLFRQGAGAGVTQGGAAPPALAPVVNVGSPGTTGREVQNILDSSPGSCTNLVRTTTGGLCCNDNNSCPNVQAETSPLSELLIGYESGRVYTQQELLALNQNNANNENIVIMPGNSGNYSDAVRQEMCTEMVQNQGGTTATAYTVDFRYTSQGINRQGSQLVCVKN